MHRVRARMRGQYVHRWCDPERVVAGVGTRAHLVGRVVLPTHRRVWALPQRPARRLTVRWCVSRRQHAAGFRALAPLGFGHGLVASV